MKRFYYTINVLLGRKGEEMLVSLNLADDRFATVSAFIRRVYPVWHFVESF